MSRCLIIAEAGLNHNGSLVLAHQMIDAAADAQVDAVKFQCYRTDDFITDQTLTYNGEPQHRIFKRCELPDEAWPRLKAHCQRHGLLFFATPTSIERLDMLVRLGVPMLKNGSDYLGHLPLIRAMARTGLPTILSTGMATGQEIEAAIGAFEAASGGHAQAMTAQDLTLMHCTSVYPCPPDEVNLLRLDVLRHFGYDVAFSDHTVGVTAAVGAVALGATMIEKHFTLSHQLDGPDHHFSADPAELKQLVGAVREMEAMLGNPALGPTVSELDSRRDFRVTYSDTDDRYLRR